jgi:RNA polymerase sigma-70 factor (ECF subfamily)
MGDQELLEAWRGGDGAAGDALFARYFDDLYRFFSRKISNDVSDLVQHTFLKCLESRDDFRGESSVRTYLYAIARNELYRHFRENARNARLDFSISSLRDLGESPSTHASKRSENALLLMALEQIPLELQIAIELHYWEGMSGAEVAAVLDIPEGTVRSRLRRGLEQLRELVGSLSQGASAPWAAVGDFERWARARRPYEESVG